MLLFLCLVCCSRWWCLTYCLLSLFFVNHAFGGGFDIGCNCCFCYCSSWFKLSCCWMVLMFSCKLCSVVVCCYIDVFIGFEGVFLRSFCRLNFFMFVLIICFYFYFFLKLCWCCFFVAVYVLSCNCYDIIIKLLSKNKIADSHLFVNVKKPK